MDGDRLVEDTRTENREIYDPHLSNGPTKNTPVASDDDTHQLSATYLEKAISASTGEYTHVALVERGSADDMWVIEASPKNGVQCISYEQFERNHNVGFFGKHIDIYRLIVPFDTVAVIARARNLVGKPYDDAFLPDNDAYYCSELIQVAFGGVFPSKPMNWRNTEGNLPEYWIKHFEKLGVPVPEGVSGNNPTDMSRSPLLKILK